MSGAGENALSGLRQEIDNIDRALVDLIAKRFACVEQVIEIKRRENIPALIEARVEDVLQRVRSHAQGAGIPPDLPDAVWRTMIDWVIGYETESLMAENRGRLGDSPQSARG